MRDCLKTTGTLEKGFCVTCKGIIEYKHGHAGHFIKRQYMTTRFHEKNVHFQCCACNTFRGGMQDEYAHYIIVNYGIDTFNMLMQMKNGIKKYTIPEVEELIEIYKQKTRELYDKVLG